MLKIEDNRTIVFEKVYLDGGTERLQDSKKVSALEMSHSVPGRP